MAAPPPPRAPQPGNNRGRRQLLVADLIEIMDENNAEAARREAAGDRDPQIDAINDFTRRRLVADGFHGRLLPPLQITNEELDRGLPPEVDEPRHEYNEAFLAREAQMRGHISPATLTELENILHGFGVIPNERARRLMMVEITELLLGKLLSQPLPDPADQGNNTRYLDLS